SCGIHPARRAVRGDARERAVAPHGPRVGLTRGWTREGAKRSLVLARGGQRARAPVRPHCGPLPRSRAWLLDPRARAPLRRTRGAPAAQLVRHGRAMDCAPTMQLAV